MKKASLILVGSLALSIALAGCGSKTTSNTANAPIVSNTAVQSSGNGLQQTGNSNQNTNQTQNSSLTNKAVGKDFSEFIPKGWHFIKKYDYDAKLVKDVIVEGDLNKDGIPDKAAIVEGTSAGNDAGPPRALIIAFGNNDKTYTLSIKAENAILKEKEGGPFGDPFNKISIDRGSLLIDFYGGSSAKWNNIYRFRYQDNGWYLIGATERGIYVTENPIREESEDYNLLTGDFIKKGTNEQGKTYETKINRGKKPLVNLKDFNPDPSQKQF